LRARTAAEEVKWESCIRKESPERDRLVRIHRKRGDHMHAKKMYQERHEGENSPLKGRAVNMQDIGARGKDTLF
jgi:hypothetical protein